MSKEEIINHLDAIKENIPTLIALINEAEEKDNFYALLELLSKSKMFDYFIQHHIKNAKQKM